jgi:hypothetical protein
MATVERSVLRIDRPEVQQGMTPQHRVRPLMPAAMRGDFATVPPSLTIGTTAWVDPRTGVSTLTARYGTALCGTGTGASIVLIGTTFPNLTAFRDCFDDQGAGLKTDHKLLEYNNIGRF